LKKNNTFAPSIKFEQDEESYIRNVLVLRSVWMGANAAHEHEVESAISVQHPLSGRPV
jgi:hypothetical protein